MTAANTNPVTTIPLQELSHVTRPIKALALDVSAADADLSVVFPPCATGIYVGGAGDLTVQFTNDADPVTFSAVPVGTTILGLISYVFMSGTTATLLVAVQ